MNLSKISTIINRKNISIDRFEVRVLPD